MTQEYTIASAPGKVLVTGGYLVLEQQYPGLVIGTTSRFYTVIASADDNLITVQSPQFDNAEWKYEARLDENNKLQFSTISGGKNPFVEACVQFSLEYVFAKCDTKKLGCNIVIVGDNDFYSQRAQLKEKGLENTFDALASLDPFCKTHATLGTVHKTGLGSSAALTTSLVAGLLKHFGAVKTLSENEDLCVVHNTAQLVHCYAQGKVGSGFDVSSAVYGSHRYNRFSPSVLKPMVQKEMDDTWRVNVVNPSKDKSTRLEQNVEVWDSKVAPFSLPPKFDLILADIDAGSHTPTLVGKVLNWRKENPEKANQIWTDISGLNAKVEEHFRQLSELHDSDLAAYNNAIKTLSNSRYDAWTATSKIEEKMVALANDFMKLRGMLRELTELSGVPIEPKEQTQLLDACMNVPGVVMAGVPGAGGFDAIFCIVTCDEAKQKVRELWQEWKELSVAPLLSEADSNGVKSVTLESVPGLSNVLMKE